MKRNFVQAGQKTESRDAVLEIAAEVVQSYPSLRNAEAADVLGSFAVDSMIRMHAAIEALPAMDEARPEVKLTGVQIADVLDAVDVCDTCVQKMEAHAALDLGLRPFVRAIRTMYEQNKGTVMDAVCDTLWDMDVAQRRDLLGDLTLSGDLGQVLQKNLASRVTGEYENALEQDFGVLQQGSPA